MPHAYPKEIRDRVLDMVDHGATVTEIRAALGPVAPATTTVSRWKAEGRDHRPRGRLYPAETIGQVVANILVRGATRAATAEAFDVTVDNIRYWLKRYRPEAATVGAGDFTAVAQATMALVVNGRKQKQTKAARTRAAKAQAANTAAPAPITAQLTAVDERDPAGEDGPAGVRDDHQKEPAHPRVPGPIQEDQLPDDPAALKQMLVEERIHRAVAEAKVVLLGKDVVPAGNRDATDLIDYLRAHAFRPVDLYTVVGIAKSTYHRLSPQRMRPRPDRHAGLRQEIIEIATKAKDDAHSSGYIYGYRKIHRQLARSSRVVSEKIVRRLMAELEITPQYHRANAYRSYRGENEHTPANLLLVQDTGTLPAAAGGPSAVFTAYNQAHPQHPRTHDFHADAPYQRLVTDVTEFKCADGKLYLSPMIDLYDGMPVSVSAGYRPTMELVMTMLEDTLAQLPEGACPIIHSDRGFHYRANAWVAATTTPTADGHQRRQFIASMSRKGTSGDNAVAEGFFGTLKRELFPIKRQTESMTRQQVLTALDQYLDWYIRGRINARLDYVTIAEFRGQDPQPNTNAA